MHDDVKRRPAQMASSPELGLGPELWRPPQERRDEMNATVFHQHATDERGGAGTTRRTAAAVGPVATEPGGRRRKDGGAVPPRRPFTG